ncbi:MAG: SDR family NAD(P)-dependent oxidoreductase [Acidimicrobiales bacterium]
MVEAEHDGDQRGAAPVPLLEEAGGTAAAVADVSDERSTAEAIGSLRERLGPVDVLVNNAGVAGPIGRAWEVDLDQWWRTVEINLKGVLVCTRLVLSDMIERGGGRVINVTSEAGVYRWPNVSAYAVSKGAVVKFTENLAAETKREGVVVLSVHPGLHAVGLTEAVLAHEALPGSAQAEVADWLRQELSGRRAACPEQAAELIVRLAAGGGDALSGRHLSVHDDLDLADRAGGRHPARRPLHPSAARTSSSHGAYLRLTDRDRPCFTLSALSRRPARPVRTSRRRPPRRR